MIGQYLSNKNESTIVPKSKNFLDLNKALMFYMATGQKAQQFNPRIPKKKKANCSNPLDLRPCLVLQKFCKIFQPSHRIFRRMHRVLNIDKNKN